MSGFRFAFPWAFLLLLPLAFAGWRLLRKGSRRVALPFAPMHRLPVRTSGWRSIAARVAPYLFLAGSLLLVVAAARPQTYFAKERHSADAIAIAMVVDVSGSMEALDLSPISPLLPGAKTRLEVVKDVFAQFIEERPDDLVALVTFGGYASTRSPLTADHDALLQILKGTVIPKGDAANARVSSDELMTAVGDGLATACARLQNAEPTTRIAVLLSDGVSNTGIITPDRAAELAKELGIKVYTIGVGSNGEVPVKVQDPFGREVVRNFIVEFDETQLKSIAETTGGRYFSVSDNKGFRAAVEEIDKLEKTKVERVVYNNYNEKFAWFLLAGAALAMAAVLVNSAILRRPL